MTDSNFQIIAVDNDSRELDKIRKAFDLLKTPCLPILYNEGDNIDEKYSNIRIAFFDINLGGLGNPADPLLCNIIASALKEILDKNNGPYALIFWSLHISKLPIIKKYIEEREKDDIPSPLVIDTINKALINNVDELKAEIQRVLANSTLNAMLDYEKKAHDAASKTINSLFSLIPRGNDKWGENIIFENNFDLIFSKMAANTMGIKLARKTPVIAIQRTLFPILQDNIKIADRSYCCGPPGVIAFLASGSGSRPGNRKGRGESCRYSAEASGSRSTVTVAVSVPHLWLTVTGMKSFTAFSTFTPLMFLKVRVDSAVSSVMQFTPKRSSALIWALSAVIDSSTT